MTKYQGTGAIVSSDFKDVKWVGKNKAGNPVTIELKNAINLGNLDWTFADKDDTVASIEFTATYDNTNVTSKDTKEPWTLEVDGEEVGAGEIILGAGIFYIGENAIALSRGGGKFIVEREYREIEADGDRGPVKDRIVLDRSVPKLTMNILTILAKVSELYPAIAKA
jgi:hypothetical protein